MRPVVGGSTVFGVSPQAFSLRRPARTRPFIGKLIAFSVFFLVVFMVCFSVQTVWPFFGQEIVVIRSQDLPLYQQVMDGFKKVYKGPFKEIDLKGDPKEFEKQIVSLKKNPPALVITIGLFASRIVQERLSGTPMLFCMVFDPERFNLSGRNITGVALDVPVSELFSQIKKILPNAKTGGVLYDPKKTGRGIREAQKAAQAQGLALISEKVDSKKMVPTALRSLLNKVDFLWMIPDSTVITEESVDFILLTSFENNIPIVTFSEDIVKRGAVLAVVPDYAALGEQVGQLAQRIFTGESADRIPIQSLEKVRFSVNLKTAKKMGILLNTEEISSADKIDD
ncbi:MAG: ABC transporter substrate-binding protein [Nitrospirota bacterium]